MSGPDHDAAGSVVGDSLVCRGRVVERVRGGDGKWPKLPGLEVGRHLLKAPSESTTVSFVLSVPKMRVSLWYRSSRLTVTVGEPTALITTSLPR